MKRILTSIVALLALSVGAVIVAPITNAQVAPLKYVALGDSYSSGNGADIVPGQLLGDSSVYEPGTNTATNMCLRSSKAYPKLLAAQKGYALTDVACGGATTDTLLTTGQNNEPAQVTAITPDTGLVTLTIGGNDVGFAPFVSCVLLQVCTTTSPEVVATNAQLAALPAKLSTVMDTIKAKAPNAQVRVAGYPQVVPNQGQPATGCRPWLNQNEQGIANDVETRLNAAIKAATVSAGPHFKYVDPFAANSPFQSRDLVGLTRDACSLSAGRYINGVRADSQPGSFHPNILGHQAYLTLFNASL